jgi:thiamine pyrophosphate-dependent acetolactate synthase large subunit-like protein
MSLDKDDNMEEVLSAFLSSDGPMFLEVFTDPEEFHEPKVSVKLDENGNFVPGDLKDIQWIN